MAETPRQRFIRNGEESVRIMRASAVNARREGRHEGAARIDKMADSWERINRQAEEHEGGSNAD